VGEESFAGGKKKTGRQTEKFKSGRKKRKKKNQNLPKI